jgi:hypothetical protein
MNRSRVSDAAECPPVAVINHGPGFADSLQTPPHAAVLSHAMTARLLAGSPTQLLSYTRESSPKKRPENLRIRALALVTYQARGYLAGLQRLFVLRKSSQSENKKETASAKPLLRSKELTLPAASERAKAPASIILIWLIWPHWSQDASQ